MNYLDLPYPHGFLIWRGKQTAIASDRLLDGNKFLIVTDNDAFGEAILGKPTATTVKRFEQEQESHCIKSYERKLLWPKAESLYIYPVKEFKAFDEPVLFLDGKIADYQPEPDEQKMIDAASELPKTIILDSEAVCAGNNGFDICKSVKNDDNLIRVLKAVYDKDITDDNSEISLPIYQLALVRNPKLIVKKKEINSEEAKQMPWEIREGFEDCSGFAVVKIDDDSIAGCHETMEEAEAQITALVLSEEEENASDEMPEEEEKQELEIAEGFAIIDTSTGDVISCHPTQEAATERLEEMMAEDEEMGMDEEEEEKAGKRLNSTMIKRLKDAWQTIKDILAWGEYKEDKQFMQDNYGIAIKEVNGKPWIFTWSSNAFEDRDKEIISTKALEEWSNEVNQREDKGYFNFWHIGVRDNPGLTDFAKKEWTGVPGRILVEAGPFLDNEKGQRALKFFKQHLSGHPEFAPEGWGCSIEFKFLPEERATGVFDNVEITRTSVLPRFAAANIHTQVKEIKTMAMSDEQKQAALEIFGKELGSELIATAENKSKELEANVAHKEEEEQEKQKQVSVDDIVAELVKQMNVNIEPLTQAITEMQEKQEAMAKEFEQYKKQEAIKEESEMPKFYFQAIRASEAKSTVTDDNDLISSKPEETNKKPLSVAGHYFGGK